MCGGHQQIMESLPFRDINWPRKARIVVLNPFQLEAKIQKLNVLF